MVKEKQREEQRALSFEYRAREVPKHVKEHKYTKLMRSQEERRQEAKRLAMAKIKATEAPFKFYERDLKNHKEKLERAELPPEIGEHAPFRAGKIPWKVLVPLYKSMVDDAETERDRRVRKNAEVSLSLSKLPPRMAQDEIKRKQKAEVIMREN
jgi:hypothetical protein